MPYKSDKIRIAGTKFDRRAKLTPDQRRAILILSAEGYSQRRLAAMFGCSKRLVQNLLQPPAPAPPKKRPAAYWAEKKRESRLRKQRLLLEGEIRVKKTIAKTNLKKRRHD